MPTNKQPRYYELLREAFKTAEAVDDFDVVSSDPKSVKEFQKLLVAQSKAQIALVEYILQNQNAIKGQLKQRLN